VFLTGVSGHGDYGSHVVPAMVVLGIGLGLAFVAVTIAATSGVAPEDSGLASGLLNTTQQVGGSLGLAILSTVSTTRVTNALHAGAALPVALTHGFKGAFTVAGLLCASGAFLALVLLPRREGTVENEAGRDDRPLVCPLPRRALCGYLSRAVALARRMRKAPAHK
jgi:MFS family permease